MWVEEDLKLVNQYKFKDFKEAMKFINEVAMICEKVNHHPEIYTVKVRLNYVMYSRVKW